MKSDEKLREMILFLSLESEDDVHYGAVKLNKLLFYADLEALQRLGRTISGQSYQKLPLGPAVRRMLPVLEDMAERKDAITREQALGRYAQKRTFALRGPNFGVFDGAELEILEEVVERFKCMNASEISDYSHGFLGWTVVNEGDTIPLGAIFFSDRPLTREEREHGCTVVA